MQSAEEYYRYGTNPDNWDFKQPPQLSRDVVDMMKREHVDDRYRFVWMGAATLRFAEKYDPHPIILGDPAALVYVRKQLGFKSSNSAIITGKPDIITPRMVDWLEPKNLFVRVKKAKFWYWTDAEGQIHQAPRPDELVTPEHALVERFDVILELGHLVWELQYRLSGEQLVAGHFYHPANAPKEYWHTIKTFRSSTHGYIAPAVLDVENMIVKREWENRNLTPGEMRELIKQTAKAEHERLMAARNAKEAADKAEFDAQAEDIIQHSMSRAPNAGGMALVS